MSLLAPPVSFVNVVQPIVPVVRDPPDAALEAMLCKMKEAAARDMVRLPDEFIRQAAEKAAEILRNNPDIPDVLLHHPLHAAMIVLLKGVDLDANSSEKLAVSLAWAARPYM